MKRKLAMLWLLLMPAVPALASGVTPELWFAPMFEKMQPYGRGKAPISYTSLFEPGAPWTVTSAHVSVFDINAHYVKVAGDKALNELFQYLRTHRIKIAIEFSVLNATPGKPHLEGFFPEPELARSTIDRIKAHGGWLDYVTMDEPFWYGSIYSGPGEYHWTAEQIAANAVQTMKIFQASFPNIQLGDVEPVIDSINNKPLPDLADRYGKWIDAIQAAWGRPLAFFNLDVVWNKPWREAFAQVVPMIRAKHVPLGIIYNQAYKDHSNDHWLDAAREHYEDIENNGGLVPDHAVFESWSAMPNHLLPETSPHTHTNLIYLYLRGRVNFTAQREGSVLSGALSDATGHPIPNADVNLEILPAGADDSAEKVVWTTLKTETTDVAGKIEMTLPPNAAPGDRFRLEFPGDASHRGARAPTLSLIK